MGLKEEWGCISHDHFATPGTRFWGRKQGFGAKKKLGFF